MNRSMLFMSLVLVSLGAAVDLPGLRTAAAEEPFTTHTNITNAALIYWQAFEALPELSDEEFDEVEAILAGTRPIAAAQTFLTSGQPALRLTAMIKPETPCRWELINLGPFTAMPHLLKAREMTRLMRLQIKASLESGNSQQAVDQFASAMLLARSVDEGPLVHLLIGDSIESELLELIEPRLSKLERPALARLSAKLAQLPPRVPLALAMKYEQTIFANSLRPLFTGETPIEPLQSLMTLEAAKLEFGDALTGTKEQRVRRFNEFQAEYVKLIAAAKLPLVQREAKLRELEESARTSENKLIALMMPVIGTTHKRHTECDSRYDKFVADVQKLAASNKPLK